MNDPDGVFKIKLNHQLSKKDIYNGVVWKDNGESISSITLLPHQHILFSISCTPRNIQNYEGTLQLSVIDNQFEDTLIQLIGEGYLEDVTIDNLHSFGSIDFEEDIIGDDDVTGKKRKIFI